MWVLQNIGTDSFVSHTEASILTGKDVALVWDDKRKAARHAYDLHWHYSQHKPSLTPEQRSWRVLEATEAQRVMALKHGAYGTDYQDITGQGQTG